MNQTNRLGNDFVENGLKPRKSGTCIEIKATGEQKWFTMSPWSLKQNET